MAPHLKANKKDSNKLNMDVEIAIIELYLTSFTTYERVVPIDCVMDIKLEAIRHTIT